MLTLLSEDLFPLETRISIPALSYGKSLKVGCCFFFFFQTFEAILKSRIGSMWDVASFVAKFTKI